MLLVARLPLLAPVAMAAIVTLCAQQTPKAPSTAIFRPSALLIPFLAPVSGEPITVTYEIKIERPQFDGSTETLGSTFQVARDSKGRISHELRQRVPASSAGAAPLLGLFLYDPRTRMSQTIDLLNRTDVELLVHLQTPAVSLQPPDVSASSGSEIEDLGRKMISGLVVNGIHETWTGPAPLLFTGQSSPSSDERWYSNDLHMIVSERRINPFGEGMMITMSGIDRRQPPSSLFKVPQGYKVIRPQRRLLTSFAADAWAIPPPDYDPNDVFGSNYYPFGFAGFSFLSPAR